MSFILSENIEKAEKAEPAMLFGNKNIEKAEKAEPAMLFSNKNIEEAGKAEPAMHFSNKNIEKAGKAFPFACGAVAWAWRKLAVSVHCLTDGLLPLSRGCASRFLGRRRFVIRIAISIFLIFWVSLLGAQ